MICCHAGTLRVCTSVPFIIVVIVMKVWIALAAHAGLSLKHNHRGGMLCGVSSALNWRKEVKIDQNWPRLASYCKYLRCQVNDAYPLLINCRQTDGRTLSPSNSFSFTTTRATINQQPGPRSPLGIQNQSFSQETAPPMREVSVPSSPGLSPTHSSIIHLHAGAQGVGMSSGTRSVPKEMGASNRTAPSGIRSNTMSGQEYYQTSVWHVYVTTAN